MGNHPSNPSNHQPLDKNVGKFGDIHARRSLRSPRKMDRLRKSFRDSFRRRKDRIPESSKPHQWQEDETAVRQANCAFSVKYLGCVEVFESRGMQVCEEALKVLRNSNRRRHLRAMLHVSGDGLRVVEDQTKGLIVDQTIEKVSFCAPDRNHERGFSYICRDGASRRWMCHGFLATSDTGERLSHAVGCAFAVCLEKKQRRDKECAVTMTFDAKNSTFTRQGSFRQQSITDRINERPVDVTPGLTSNQNSKTANPFAIERPHATPSLLERQNSCRLGQLGPNSPFKRQMSLRVQDLPSNAERLNLYKLSQNGQHQIKSSVSPIPELEPVTDPVAALCQQLSQGLTQLTHSGSDDFNFNTQSTVNQNNVAMISITTTSTFNAASSSNNTFSVTSPPSNVTPLSVNLDDIVSLSSISPSPKVLTQQQSSPNSSLVSNTSLPKPEQWLGQIVDSSSPNTSLTSSSAITTAPTTVALANNRSKVMLGAHSRAMSLDSSGMDNFTRPGIVSDPFNAEWADAISSKTPATNTNPFLSNATQAFQVQL